MDMGFDTFDCADIYTGVEDFFGSIIRRRRKAGLAIPQIHTKFVPDLNDLDHINRDYVERIITRSIQRLGVEQLDMVQLLVGLCGPRHDRRCRRTSSPQRKGPHSPHFDYEL